MGARHDLAAEPEIPLSVVVRVFDFAHSRLYQDRYDETEAFRAETHTSDASELFPQAVIYVSLNSATLDAPPPARLYFSRRYRQPLHNIIALQHHIE